MGAVRRFTLAFWIILLVILINPAVGIAQSCEALPVDGSPLSYRFRANVPRCEGMYRSPVSGHPGMTLVSLTYGKVAYDTRRDQYLEIKLTVEPAETTLIQAIGIPERLYYRLDAELGRGKSVFMLPLADVVAANKILPEQFGIYAVRKLPGSQNIFVPVYAHGSVAAAQGDVVAVMRPGADVTDVRWRSYAPGVPLQPGCPLQGRADWCPKARGWRSCSARTCRRR